MKFELFDIFQAIASFLHFRDAQHVMQLNHRTFNHRVEFAWYERVHIRDVYLAFIPCFKNIICRQLHDYNHLQTLTLALTNIVVPYRLHTCKASEVHLICCGRAAYLTMHNVRHSHYLIDDQLKIEAVPAKSHETIKEINQRLFNDYYMPCSMIVADFFSDVIDQFSNLQSLILTSNSHIIQHIDIRLPDHLQRLTLHNISLQSLPSSLRYFKCNLTRHRMIIDSSFVDLEELDLPYADCVVALEILPSLKRLTLTRCRHHCALPKSLAYFNVWEINHQDMLHYMKNVKELIVWQYRLLQLPCQLQRLHVHYNVPFDITFPNTLTHLTLEGCEYDFFRHKHLPHLQYLHINDNCELNITSFPHLKTLHCFSMYCVRNLSISKLNHLFVRFYTHHVELPKTLISLHIHQLQHELHCPTFIRSLIIDRHYS